MKSAPANSLRTIERLHLSTCWVGKPGVVAVGGFVAWPLLDFNSVDDEGNRATELVILTDNGVYLTCEEANGLCELPPQKQITRLTKRFRKRWEANDRIHRLRWSEGKFVGKDGPGIREVSYSDFSAAMRNV